MKPAWLITAEHEIGVKELKGSENPRIVEYGSCTTLKPKDDETAWCSNFVNWCMKQVGIKGTNLANARSWLNWGIKLDYPIEGCVVVLKRGNNPISGHVGFFIEKLPGGWIKVLGGNQADSVKYSNFKESEVLGYREPNHVA